MLRGQISPLYARRIAQWGRDDGGLISLSSAADILPPELLPHLSALRPPSTGLQTQPTVDENKYGFFNNIPISIGLGSTLVLRQPTTRRIFLFFVNTHATQTLFIRFGADSTALIGVPIVPANGFIGFDAIVPQDDVYMIANGAVTTGVGLYCNKEQ